VTLHSVFSVLPGQRRLYWLLLTLSVLGIISRLVVMSISYGSNDMRAWEQFATFINQNGLWQTYVQIEKFNHPPLMGLMAAALESFSAWSSIPFRLCWKVPPLMGDLFGMWLLWRHFAPRGGLWAMAFVAAFSCNPVSIAVTAFHGNTDSLLAVLALYAAILHRRGRLLGAGLALAAAVNVKVIALIFVPGYLLLCGSAPLALRFGAGMALGSVPILTALLKAPGAFPHNVFGYNSQIAPWGVDAWAMYSHARFPELYAFLTIQYRAVGKYVIAVLTLTLAILARLRSWDAVRLGAATMSLFLFVTPGFGVQYLVWLVPLLAGYSMRYSIWWGLLAGAFLVLTYQSFLVNEWPLRSLHFIILEEPFFVPREPMGTLGLLAWMVLGRYLYREVAYGLLLPPSAPVPELATILAGGPAAMAPLSAEPLPANRRDEED
jgi:hypothetical protein